MLKNVAAVSELSSCWSKQVAPGADSGGQAARILVVLEGRRVREAFSGPLARLSVGVDVPDRGAQWEVVLGVAYSKLLLSLLVLTTGIWIGVSM
jgi:hypothetical protein